MLLRKKVKEGEQGVLEIFRKVNMQAYRDDEDYKRLEAVLRKYLNEFKLSAKEEQITRYKNTLKSYRSSCEVLVVICRNRATKRTSLTRREGWWLRSGK